MQEPLRKQKKKIPHARLWIFVGTGVFLALCIVGILLLNRPGTPKVLYREMTNGTLLSVDKEQVSSVSVKLKNGEQWILHQYGGDGRLFLNEATEWSIDRGIGDMILDVTATVTYEEVLTEKREDYEDHEEEFGLKEPFASVRIEYADGRSLDMRIGDEGAYDESYHYMLVDGDERLFALDKGTVQTLTTETGLFYPVTQPEIISSLIDHIRIEDGTGKEIKGWRLSGSVTDADAGEKWFTTAPYVYPADQTAMENLLGNTGNCYLGTFVDMDTPENRTRYGLDESRGTLVFHMAAGTINSIDDKGRVMPVDVPEKTMRFAVGGKKNGMTDYVLYEDAIYSMNRFQLDVFMEADLSETVSKHVFTVAKGNLKEIQVEEDQKVTGYLIHMVPETDENGNTLKDENDQTVYTGSVTKDGEEVSFAAFDAAYERLRVATVSGRLPSGWKAEKEAYKKYTFRTQNGGTHTLELIWFDDFHDAVVSDGYALFYILRGSITELP